MVYLTKMFNSTTDLQSWFSTSKYTWDVRNDTYAHMYARVTHDAAKSRFCGRSCPDMAARCFHGKSLPPMFASQGRSSCARMPTNTRPWRFGNFVWILGKKHCALKFENKQGFGTCPKSFFGGKKCKTSSLWFRIQWVQYSGVLHAGVNRLSLGSNREGCVQGLKSLKGLF